MSIFHLLMFTIYEFCVTLNSSHSNITATASQRGTGGVRTPNAITATDLQSAEQPIVQLPLMSLFEF